MSKNGHENWAEWKKRLAGFDVVASDDIQRLRAEIERLKKQLENALRGRRKIERIRVCKICKHYDPDDQGTGHYCNLGIKRPRPCEKWGLDDGELRVWVCPALEAAERTSND